MYDQGTRDRLETSESKTDIANALLWGKQTSSAYKDLIGMVKGGMQRLTHSVKESKEQIAIKSKPSTVATGKKGQVAVKNQVQTSMLFEIEWGAVKSIQVDVDGKCAESPNWTRPVILRMSTEAPIVKVGSAIVKEVDSLGASFATSSERADPGRAQRAIEGKDDYMKFMKAVFGEQLHQPGEKQNFEEKMVPVCYAVCKNRVTAGIESCGLVAVRVCNTGTRQVVTLPIIKLAQYLQRQAQQPYPVKPKKVFDWLKVAKPDSLRAFVDECSSGSHVVHSCTVGPLDALFTPPGWCFIERVGSSDTTGTRFTYISLKEEAEYDLYGDYLTFSDKTNPLVTAIRDYVLLAEA